MGHGRLDASPGNPTYPLAGIRHGFWRRHERSRALVHADGTSALVVADTPWAMPWRARLGDVEVYARRRAQQGFNAALLMTLQPDMKAVGPRARDTDLGFEVGFDDLPEGHLNEINVDYFRYLDIVTAVLIEHGITPVLQPLFFGFGWKALQVGGPVVPALEYARYCRYLVARYGAGPVMYLVAPTAPATNRGSPPVGKK